MSTHVAVGPGMARRALVLLVGKLSAMIISILAAFIIPRQLGPRGMGFYSYFYSSVFTMVCILDAGGSMLLRRYVPELLAHGRGQVRPLFWASLRAKAIVMGLFAAAIPFIPDRGMYALALTAGILTSLVESAQAVLYTAGALTAYAVVLTVLTGTRVILLVTLAPVLQRLGISLALVMSATVALVAFFPRAVRLLPPSGEQLSQSYWRFLRFGLISYSADLAFVLGNRLALIAGRHTLDDMAELGYLGVAFMVYLLARQVAFFIGETSLPTLVHYHASRQWEQFSRTMYHVWRYTNIVVFLASALVLCYAEPLVTLVVGNAFVKTAVLIKLLVPAFAATTLTLCVRMALFVRERSLRLLISHGGALIVFGGGVLTLAVTNQTSLSSEAIATMFSGSAILGFFAMAFRSGMRVPTGKLLLAAFKPAVAAGMVCGLVSVVGPRGGWVFVSLPVSVIAYLAVLLVVRGMEWRDWHRILALVGRRNDGDESDTT